MGFYQEKSKEEKDADQKISEKGREVAEARQEKEGKASSSVLQPQGVDLQGEQRASPKSGVTKTSCCPSRSLERHI